MPELSMPNKYKTRRGNRSIQIVHVFVEESTYWRGSGFGME